MNDDVEEIRNQLFILTELIKNMNNRLEKIEEKTTEIHDLVPFGHWFEKVTKRLTWFKRGSEKDPQMIENIPVSK